MLKQLKELKVKKAKALDRISARFLKDSATVIAPTVAFLVNLSLSTEMFLMTGKRLVLFLCTSQVVVRTWTTIDLSRFCQCYQKSWSSKAFDFQLQQYLKRFDLPSPFQSGFRQHSTDSTIIYFSDD